MSGIFRAMNMSEESSLPDKEAGTDSEVFDPARDPSMSWESSPEQGW